LFHRSATPISLPPRRRSPVRQHEIKDVSGGEKIVQQSQGIHRLDF
jgi:hypothetical protein